MLYGNWTVQEPAQKVRGVNDRVKHLLGKPSQEVGKSRPLQARVSNLASCNDESYYSFGVALGLISSTQTVYMPHIATLVAGRPYRGSNWMRLTSSTRTPASLI